MCLFHKWGKWVQYRVELPGRRIAKRWFLCPAVETRQRKICQKCNKVKDEYVSMTVLE